MGTEHEEHSFLMIKDKNLSQIKADLIHAFLCVGCPPSSVMEHSYTITHLICHITSAQSHQQTGLLHNTRLCLPRLQPIVTLGPFLVTYQDLTRRGC